MTKKEKEEQEKMQFLSDLVNEKREFTDKQKELIERFIFNILCSNTILNRYSQTRYGNIVENYDECVTIYDCINYLGNKLKEA